MKKSGIIRQGRKRFSRFYRMVAVSAAICVAVISGSLIVGDSVRKSLQSRVEDRLFGMKSVVVSGDGFLERSAVERLSLGQESLPAILMEGFLSRNGRLIPVVVWGMDTLPDGSPLPGGEIAINDELRDELGDISGEDLVLRLPDDGLVPSSSLFVTSRYSVSMRLSFLGSIGASKGGNLCLRNSQVIPFNVFVNRGNLCETLGLGDKINLILSPSDISAKDLSSLGAEDFGIRMDEGKISSDAVFLKGNIVDKLYSSSENPVRLFSYLVNSIEANGKSIPYSFATAMDSWEGKPVPSDGAVLSDYAARRLGVKAGDEVTVRYFVSDDLKNLSEKGRTFKVSEIVPLSKMVEDGALSADFPGLADAESCSSWDSDLPIDMGRISDEDEDYWSDYGPTPKILLPYSEMRTEWSDSWGEATQIRTSSSHDILSVLTSEDFPVSVIQPYDEAMDNAVGGVDFGGLFLALGCFIVIAALFLLKSPLEEMYSLRRDELSLLSSLGFTGKDVSGILLREVLPVAIIGSLIGAVLAILYAGGVIFLLGNIWSGATQTDGFSLYPHPHTITAGFLAGLLFCFGVILLTVRKASSSSRKKAKDIRRDRNAAIVCSALLIAAIIYGAIKDSSVAVFVIIGCLFLSAGIFWARYLVGKGDPKGTSSASLTHQALRYSLPEVTTGIIALALGVFITFAVGLNRKDFSNLKALEGGTGGYDFWCELTVPLQHDISTPEGRRAMNLSALGEDASVMQLTLVGGDDASCLNLNKITAPAILGFREKDFLSGKFRIKDNIFSLKDDKDVLERMTEGDGIYCLVDETVLMWGLMKSLGDTLHYRGASGEIIDVVIAGSIPNTVFQGYALMPESVLEKNWTERGSKLLLVKSPNPDAGTVLETALNEYGIRAMGANQRLRQLGRVTDTYLTIFMMLGLLGLLLGIASFVVGVRKRLSTRKKDILLLRSLGYTDTQTAHFLKKENTPAPVAAVLLGLSAAVISVIVSFGAISAWTWAICILGTILCILLIILSVGRMTSKMVTNTEFADENTDSQS